MANNSTFMGFKTTHILIVAALVLACVLLYSGGYLDSLKTQSIADNTTHNGLVLTTRFDEMLVGNVRVANADYNYNAESGVIAIQVDAEKSSNATHTNFIIKSPCVEPVYGSEVRNETQVGVLSVPTEDVLVPVSVRFTLLNTYSGFSSTSDVLSSTVNASSTSLKDANGVKFYPVAIGEKSNSPAVYVNDGLYAKNIVWTMDKDENAVVVSFDLNWTGIDKMTSVSDEVTIPIKISNSDSDLTVRIIKNSVL
ncbi:hypothetical protein [Methanolapillus millepedarum]|uniref:Uncharacterized protein n=1 Tax=Methanolapillus millepedarum TaxID=3028296 RepID=A0AA96V2A1_9EURY|nr:hypothetical protein MsAc7_06940 [Methanosarcinaceae archaeon Ac7]